MTDILEKPFKVYRASAGSGKTYTLVKEYLTLCLGENAGDTAYKEILAVTFTNKAANEMKAKILEDLEGIIENKSDFSDIKNDLLHTTQLDENILVEKAKRLYKNILHNYSDFSILTIDSFIQHLSRSFAKELDLPNSYNVFLDDDDLVEEVIRRIGDKIGDNNKYLTGILTEFIEYQLSEENNWRVETPIRDFVKKLLKEKAYRKGEKKNAKSITEEQYKEIKSFIKNKSDYYINLINKDIISLENINEEFGISDECFNHRSKGLLSILEKLRSLELQTNTVKETNLSLLNKSITKIFDNKDVWYSKNVLKKVGGDKIETIGQEIISRYKKTIDDYYCLYLLNIVRRDLYLYVLRDTIYEIINQYIEESNQVHISEFNKRISDVIADCKVPFIYERIGERYKHYFIDEFQDTSTLQWFNFLPLVHDSLSEGNMNLLVGDAKQAIYRFRNGEVEQIIKLPEIFKCPDNEFGRDCQRQFVNTIEYKSLKKNYRSTKNIVLFNNSFFDFSNKFLERNDYIEVYKNNLKQAYRQNQEYDGLVRVEIFKMDEFKEEGKNRANQKLYKNAVKNSMLKQIKQLINKEFKYKDITILVRSNADGSDIAEYLTHNKIPVISADSILLKSSNKVQLIILTLKYLLHNDNPVTKLSLMYFLEACNIVEKDFCDLQTVLNSDFDDEKIINIRNQSYSLYDICARIVKIYGFKVIDDVFLQYFMNLVQDWQNTQNQGIEMFLEYWERKRDTFFVMISGDVNAVQIMTIHKAKGLQFKVVLYPYAFTALPEKLRSTEEWLNCKDFETLKDIPYIDTFLLNIKKDLAGTKFERYYTEEKEKAMLDDFNIMYVAMTRPEDLLFMYSNDYESSSAGSYNIFNEYFKFIAENVIPDMRCEKNEEERSTVYQFGEIEYHEKKDKKSAFDVLKLDENKTSPDNMDWVKSLKVDPDPTMFWAEKEGFMPQEWGTMVHDILSDIKTIDDAVMAIRPYINDGTLDEEQGERLLKQFQKIVNIPEIKEAYDKNALIKNEMDILTVDGMILRPDRYAELPNEIILIDYKTGKPDESHHEQLRSYMAALQNMNVRKNIKAYLVYIGEEIMLRQVFLDRFF